MRRTKALLGWLLPALAAVAAVWPITSLAQPDVVEPEAIALLRRATDYLAALKQFRLDADATIEFVLADGQKLQFGQRVSVTIQRPNKMRVERVGDLVSQAFYYDGKSLSVNLPDKGFYATVAAPATIEATLDYARDKLDVIAPGSDLVYVNAFERLTAGLTSGFVVNTASVGGVPCDHLAFRNAEVDWQIWIQQGKKPWVRKFIVTSKRMPEAPEFVVVLSKWDAAPQLTDATFGFVPPKKSKRIEFLPVSAAGAGGN